MKRWIGITSFALAALLSTGAVAHAQQTYFGFQIGVTNAPPQRFAYAPPPDLYYDPGARVYVVENDYNDWDMFRYGSTWYACDGDYWYRANSYRGPFYACDVRSVPQAIFYVPRDRWHRYPRALSMWRSRGGDRYYGRGYADTRYYGGARVYTGGRYYGNDNRYYGGDRRWSGSNGDWRTNDRGDWGNNGRPPGWDRGRKEGWDRGNGHGHGHGNNGHGRGHDRDDD